MSEHIKITKEQFMEAFKKATKEQQDNAIEVLERGKKEAHELYLKQQLNI